MARDLRNKERLIRPLTTEIGKLVWEWNQLQESLLHLFGLLITPTTPNVGYAIWHSTPNDRAQREMLRAAVEYEFFRGQVSKKARQFFVSQTIRNEIIWMLNEADIIANYRNDVVHAPYIVFEDKTGISPIPMWFFNNPRAESLKKRGDLLQYMRWSRMKAKTLSSYAIRFWMAAGKGEPLPQRPRLPHLALSRTRKKEHPQTHAKLSRLPPRSSRA